MPRTLLQAAGLACLAVIWPSMPAEAQIPPGEYASRQVVITRALTRPRGKYSRVATTSLVHHSVFRHADGLRVVNRYCSVVQDPLGPVQTELGPAFVSAIEPAETALDITGPAGGPWEVVMATTVTLIGAVLDDPEYEALPTDPEDLRVTDPDGDGHPGVTVRVRGMIDGEVYMVQRLVRELRGTLQPDGTMRGTVSGGNESEVIGASNVVLRTFTPRFEPDPDGEGNVFDWAPVHEGTTCDALQQDAPRLFDGN